MAVIDISAQVLGDEQLARTLAKLSSHDIPKAIRAGVRYAVRPARTTMAQAIGQRYTLKAARIKEDIGQPIFTNGGQAAILKTSRKPITARQFGLRESRRGVTMAIFRGERTVIKSGFMQTSQDGKFDGRRAFQPNHKRTYSNEKAKPRRSTPRNAIAMVQGPSIHAIYTGGKWAPALQARTEVRIENELVTGILRELGRVGRGFG
jgi:hypothetical protein